MSLSTENSHYLTFLVRTTLTFTHILTYITQTPQIPCVFVQLGKIIPSSEFHFLNDIYVEDLRTNSYPIDRSLPNRYDLTLCHQRTLEILCFQILRPFSVIFWGLFPFSIFILFYSLFTISKLIIITHELYPGMTYVLYPVPDFVHRYLDCLVTSSY